MQPDDLGVQADGEGDIIVIDRALQPLTSQSSPGSAVCSFTPAAAASPEGLVLQSIIILEPATDPVWQWITDGPSSILVSLAIIVVVVVTVELERALNSLYHHAAIVSCLRSCSDVAKSIPEVGQPRRTAKPGRPSVDSRQPAASCQQLQATAAVLVCGLLLLNLAQPLTTPPPPAAAADRQQLSQQPTGQTDAPAFAVAIYESHVRGATTITSQTASQPPASLARQ